MKLVIVVVQDDDVDVLAKKIIANNFRSTKLASTGGFLREGNTTFLIGVEKERVEELIAVISQVCKVRKQTYSTPIPPTGSAGVFIPYPVEISVGGAILFVLDVDQFVKI